MSRDPLAVLREYANAIDKVFAPVQMMESHALREAIAQVEALVHSARLGAAALDIAAKTVSSDLGILMGDRAMFLRHGLKPFTPGQDSEGGAHG